MFIGLFFIAITMLMSSCSQEMPPRNEITVLTYNVGWLRYPLRNLQPVDTSKDWVPEVNTRFSHWPSQFPTKAKGMGADIILLQEVYETSHSERVRQLLEAQGYETYWPSQADPTRMYSSGLLLAVKDSRISLLRHEFFPFGDNLRAGDEKLLDNGVLIAEIEIISADPTPKKFVFAGVHLQALTVDQSGRALKAEEIAAFEGQVDFLQETLLTWAPKHPRIISGDFNVGPILAGKQYEKLMSTTRLSNAAYDSLAGLPDNSATWDRNNALVARGDYSTDPSDLIDHVLFDPRAFRVTQTSVLFTQNLPHLSIPLSDHYGFMGTFKFLDL